MVKHNNVIPNVHMRKHWQDKVRTFFDQAAKKKRRYQRREDKAAKLFPRPLEKLRPTVRSQTIRYNRKLRAGRGFSLLELKQAKLGQKFATSIGISVDHRRRNKSQEGLDANKKRLLAYVNKLVLFPQVAGKPVKGQVNDTTDLPKNSTQNREHVVCGIQQDSKRCAGVKVADMKKLKTFKAFRTLRQEWANKKWNGKRLQKAKEEKKDAQNQ